MHRPTLIVLRGKHWLPRLFPVGWSSGNGQNIASFALDGWTLSGKSWGYIFCWWFIPIERLMKYVRPCRPSHLLLTSSVLVANYLVGPLAEITWWRNELALCTRRSGSRAHGILSDICGDSGFHSRQTWNCSALKTFDVAICWWGYSNTGTSCWAYCARSQRSRFQCNWQIYPHRRLLNSCRPWFSKAMFTRKYTKTVCVPAGLVNLNRIFVWAASPRPPLTGKGAGGWPVIADKGRINLKLLCFQTEAFWWKIGLNRSSASSRRDFCWPIRWRRQLNALITHRVLFFPSEPNKQGASVRWTTVKTRLLYSIGAEVFEQYQNTFNSSLHWAFFIYTLPQSDCNQIKNGFVHIGWYGRTIS